MQMTMITPSYAPDFERCRLLCESIDRFVPKSMEHVLLIDSRDEAMFKPLENSRTRIILKESVMPWWIKRTPFSRKWWLSFKSQPVRGWILQQLVKLGVGEYIESENYLMLDSDVTFIRPLDPACFFDEDKNLALHCVPGVGQTAMHARWHQTSAKLLGLPPSNYFGANYIGNMVTWRRDILLKMYRHIENTTGMPWMQAVCRQWHLSEYILYGIYVNHVLGGMGHFPVSKNKVHISWDREIDTPEKLEAFFQCVQPDHLAVMVSSKQGVSVEQYQDRMRTLYSSVQSTR
jgi:hypothetical protein